MRVALDPTSGPVLLLLSKQRPGYAAKLTRDNCRTLDVEVHRTGWRVNDIDVMAGHASFDCDLKSGGTARGQLTFEGCS